jgi:hypothetical protein
MTIATSQGNRISRSIFYENSSAAAGGAIYLVGNNSYTDKPLITIDNCVFSQNSSQVGGGVFNTLSESAGAQSALQLLSCSFNENSALSAQLSGGAICNSPGSSASCKPIIANSILWNELKGGEIFNAASAIPVISYCDVMGGAVGTNVMNLDPKFLDPTNPLGTLGLRLATTPSASPCINVGNNSLVPAWATTDVTGVNARIQNSIVDLGAYENTLP